MIGALNDESASYLQKQFANRKVKKTYVAVLEGIPSSPKAIIDLPISRNPSKPSTFKVDPKGKSAVTQYEVLESKDGRSIARLKPATGRTHQLRVHMAYLGTPIVGDRVYGKPDERLYLHALSLEITIPGGIRKTFEAPLPDEFVRLFPKAVKEL
jgi:23S rRNA-/tRNA-specific pseudouridylate synthase